MTKQTEKLDRWINAYLDGALHPEDAARFESVIDRNPSLRRHLDTHRMIEASLVRTFAPPAAAPEAPSQRSEGATIPFDAEANAKALKDERPAKRKSRGGFRRFAMAAMLLIVAGGGWAAYENRAMFMRLAEQLETGTDLSSMQAFYKESRAQDFKQDWQCKNDRQFQSTFHYRLNHGVRLAQADLPANVVVNGLKYGNTLSTQTVHLTAKVDGKGVIVFIDNKDKDRPDNVAWSGLHAYRKLTDHLVMIEVSPLDHAVLLNELSETDIPKEWAENLDIPMVPGS